MKNHERLEKNGLIKPGTKLSQQQKDALEGLSREDLDSLISVKKKLSTKVIAIPGLMGTKQKSRS